MKERHRFRPTTVDSLEPRMALSGSAHFAPVTAGRFTTHSRNTDTQDVVNNVNLSFDSFETDYLQAQGAYFAANSGSGARGAFKQYVNQRIELLAAQLTQIFTHVPGSLSQSKVSTPGGPVILQTFLKSRIDGTSEKTLHFALLGRGNGGAIPPVGTTGTTATLYTDEALSAIETSRTVTLNSVGFLYSRSFQSL